MLNDSSKAAWPWHPAQTIFLALAMFVASQLLVGLVVVSSLTLYARLNGFDNSMLERLLSGTTTTFVTIGAAEVLVILSLWWLMRRRKLSIRELGFSRRPQLSDAIWLAVSSVVYFILAVAVLAALKAVAPDIDGGQRQDVGFKDAGGFIQLSMVFIALVICAPVAEEVLFRGFLFSGIRRRWSFVTSAIVTSLIFGAAHLAGGSNGWSTPLWTLGVDTLLLSLVLCYLREKTGALWAPIGLHMAKNGLAFALVFVAA